MEVEKGDRVRLGGKYKGVKGVLTWVGTEGAMIRTKSMDEFPIDLQIIEAKLKKKTK